ncbi:MAG: RND family transporter [Acutalibacteraceae bacterium]
MRKFYSWVVNNSKKIIILFLILTIAGAISKNLVEVNYDMKDYLPDDSPSTAALDLMDKEFSGGIPNARVMVKNVSIAEALEYKEQLENCEGIDEVLWLDDSINICEPLELADKDTVENYYKNKNALFTVTIDEADRVDTVERIREIIGENNAMSGDAVSTAIATNGTVHEITLLTIFAIAAVLAILLITTTSWAEPFVVLGGLGVAIMINSGSNLIFGEISFVTNAAGAVLQLAVSLDYSVFLLHRYEECLRLNSDRKGAMADALCKSTSSIFSSGLTTVIGFLALVFMRFGIGPDLGLALAKGVALSLITVFVFMPALILTVYPLIEKSRHKSFLPSFKGFGKFINKTMIPMVLIFIIMVVPFFLASNSNSYYYGSSRIYGTDTKLGQDIESIESVFGKNDTYVVIVPNGDVDAEQKLSNALHEIPEITSVLSYVDTVGAEIPKEYLDEDTLSQLVSENYNRFVLSVDADYEGKATFDLVEKIRSAAKKYYPDTYYLAGEGVSTYDLMDTITADTLKVNLIAIAAVFVVLLLSMKSVSLPIVLVFTIEAAIWINMGFPYFWGATVHYIAYLIVSSVQLGATVDYAILFTDRYKEYRATMPKKAAVIETISTVSSSVLTSGTVLSVVGFLLYKISSHGILSQLGLFIGRGTILSMISVFFVLPGLLYMFDAVIEHTTLNINFYKPRKEKKSNETH